ncbi:hypothetical protein JYT83_00945 [bacterium AH-315-F18]|nr:hypothetical protein [bacterium AH-315-F18]
MTSIYSPIRPRRVTIVTALTAALMALIWYLDAYVTDTIILHYLVEGSAVIIFGAALVSWYFSFVGREEIGEYSVDDGGVRLDYQDGQSVFVPTADMGAVIACAFRGQWSSTGSVVWIEFPGDQGTHRITLSQTDLAALEKSINKQFDMKIQRTWCSTFMYLLRIM